VIPRELVDLNIHAICRGLTSVEDSTLVNRVKAWCLNTHKFNTHSLRYAFITYLLRRGVDATIIAKITKHSRLDYILTYTQEKIAEEVLRKI
jgi:Phage integrase family.